MWRNWEDNVTENPEVHAREAASLIRNRVERMTQVRISDKTGIAQPTISGLLKDDTFEKLCKVIAYSGLKVVPANFQAIRPDVLHSIFTLARETMNRMEPKDLMAPAPMPDQ